MVAAPVGAWLGWRWGVTSVVVLSAAPAAAFILLAPAPRGFRRTTADQRSPLARVVWANLRAPAMLMLHAQGFLLMGGFVSVYNYLAFQLRGAPFGLGTAAYCLGSSIVGWLSGLVFTPCWLGRHRRRGGRARAGRRPRAPPPTRDVILS